MFADESGVIFSAVTIPSIVGGIQNPAPPQTKTLLTKLKFLVTVLVWHDFLKRTEKRLFSADLLGRSYFGFGSTSATQRTARDLKSET